MKERALLQYLIDTSDVRLEKKQEATEYLAALTERVRVLEAALMPFADWVDTIYKEQDDDETKDLWVYVKEIRGAATVLATDAAKEQAPTGRR